MDSAPSLGGPVAARKVVTALFCDVAGSTALGELLDAEVLDIIDTGSESWRFHHGLTQTKRRRATPPA